jgi:peptide chain release factor 2
VRDFSEELAEVRRRVTDAAEYLHLDDTRARRAELETAAARPDLWDDPDQAKAVTRELSQVSEDVAFMDGLTRRLDDAEVLYELAREEDDESQEPEIEHELETLRGELAQLELRSLFTGDYDERDAICQLSFGVGGTDAQDWTQMLLRMYTRWAERRGFSVEIDETLPGQEAGISSATFVVKGRYAYGLLKGERGVHRLVRISPFDANARRQTAFSALDVIPMLDEAEAPEILEKDLRIDTYRASGAGGQHVNKTSSAVRLTHLPTGIVVACQNERSQHQNKARAMQILAAKLFELQREEQEKLKASIAGEKTDAGWGHQIRSYVLAPYQLVKDLRTGQETGNVQAVLDGDIDDFIEAWLQWRRREEGSKV